MTKMLIFPPPSRLLPKVDLCSIVRPMRIAVHCRNVGELLESAPVRINCSNINSESRFPAHKGNLFAIWRISRFHVELAIAVDGAHLGSIGSHFHD